MNKETRSDIKKIKIRLQLIRDELDVIKDKEEDKFDNLSEGLQATIRGQDMEDAIDSLGEIIDSLDEVLANLDLV